MIYAVDVAVHPAAARDDDGFVAAAWKIIKHPRGWESLGYTFLLQAPPRAALPRIRMTLTPQSVMDARFPDFQHQRLSVCNMTTRDIFINEGRWHRWYDDDKSTMSLRDYRFYVINHELGHALGFGHARCPGAGMPAPIMLQQTLGLGGCTPTRFPVAAALPRRSHRLSAGSGSRRRRSRPRPRRRRGSIFTPA
jgi:hypothetical protein